MAKEYIDKDRLILSMNDWMLQNAPVKAGDDTTRADTILDAIKMVEDSPAADVRENVRARWTVVSEGCEFADGSKAAWNVWICPICGYERTAGWEYTSPGEKPKAKLCEMCGALMGGAEDG